MDLFLNRQTIGDFRSELEKFRPDPTASVSNMCLSWVFLGERYLILGDRKQATESFRRAIDMKPGHSGCGSVGVIARLEYRRIGP